MLGVPHARERRWPVGFEINVNSRRPVMRVVRHERYRATLDFYRFFFTPNRPVPKMHDVVELESIFHVNESIKGEA